MAVTLGSLAALVQGELRGDASQVISGFGGVDGAGPGDITFAGDESWRSKLVKSAAGAAVLASEVPGYSGAMILCAEPHVAFTRIVQQLVAAQRPPAGVHPSAVIADRVQLAADVHVGPLVSIGEGAVIGAGSVLHAGCVIGPRVEVGAECVIHPRVVLEHGVRLGARVVIHAGSVIGSDGFGYVTDRNGRHVKVPQTGTVIIEDDVEIGSCVCVDRARFEATRIGRGTKIDNLVQVAHNVAVGEDCLLVALVGIAGSTRLGDRVILGGHVGVAGHLKIESGAQVAAYSGIMSDLPGATQYMGLPAIPLAEGMRVRAVQKRLPELLRRVSALEHAQGTEDVP
jgi:UDP-3-O-[3-hydroxymyristoyl] glucosamine N-acyltransferase